MKKKLLALFLVAFILAGFGIQLKAADLQPFSFPFIGRWQPSEDPTLLADYGLQDVQNVRKVGNRFKGISGHTIINTTSVSTAPYFLNGFHFRKDQPQESHVLVVTADAAIPTASYVIVNDTAIPSAGQFKLTGATTGTNLVTNGADWTGAGSSTSLVLYSTDTADDGYDVNHNFYNAETHVSFGNSAGFAVNAFLRFPSATIDPGSTITSAVLTMVASTAMATTTVNALIYADDSDSGVAPTDDATFQNLMLRLTTASTAWSNVAAWTADTSYDTPNFSNVIQEVVDRTGWASGNALQVVIKDNASSNNALRQAHSLDEGLAAHKPKLTIGYTDNAAPTGWTAYNSGKYNLDTSRLKIEKGSLDLPGISQAMTVVSGHTYLISATMYVSSPVSHFAAFCVGTSAGGEEYIDYATANTASTTAQTRSYTFKATGTTAYITLLNLTTETGRYAYFDDVTLYDVTLHADATAGIGNGRFASAPAGNVIYTNGPETLIWGGNEIEATAFITSTDSLSGVVSSATSAADYSDQSRNTRQTIDQVAIIGGGIDAYTTLLLHGDGTDGSTTITDSETTPKAVTAAGSAAIDADYYKFGMGAILFTSATSDYVYTLASSDLAMGTGNMTVDLWVRFRTVPTVINQAALFSQYVDANNYVYLIATGSSLEFSTKSTAVQYGATAIWAPVVNTWYHVCVTRDSATTVKIYINGILLGNNTTTAAKTWPDLAANFLVGNFTQNLATFGLDGWIDEFRVSKGIARWTSEFTPPEYSYRTSSKYWLVGFPRPLQGVKFYVSDENNQTSTMTAWEWNGASWTSLTITDGTSSGGVSLAQTGTVTFSSTASTSKPRYINGLSLYWYQFHVDAGQATIYYTTVDAPIQTIKNVWSGEKAKVGKFLYYNGTANIDYTDYVNDADLTTYATLDQMTSAHYLLIGFTAPQQAIEFTFLSDDVNLLTSTTPLTLYYWNGSNWTAAAGTYDAMATGTVAFSKSGVVSFQMPAVGDEFKRSVSDEVPLYYYKLMVGGTLSGPVEHVYVGEVRGIEAPLPISSYKFALEYQNRLFLFNDYYGDKNAAIYSMSNAPDIFNGSDSGNLYFGDRTDLTAAARLYNVFRNTAVDQLLVFKKNETYRVTGDDPKSWVNQRMSANIGCIAPLSVAVCDVVEGAEADAKRQVVIWQSDKGFHMTDGAAIIPISDDIKCYFDQYDSRYIPTTRQTKTVGWYDPLTRSYKALISSGSTATYHNIELEYSLQYKEWTKIKRVTSAGANDPLQSGFPVYDTNGIGYSYGGNTTGYLYRLEYGTTFNGGTIEQILHTKDFIPDAQLPGMRKSTIKYIRTMMKKKTGGGTIAVSHYGDQSLTTSGPTSINMATAPYNTQSVGLGPALYHSFKFVHSAATYDGMELTGMGLYIEPYSAMR